jgi:hypothetical protein
MVGNKRTVPGYDNGVGVHGQNGDGKDVVVWKDATLMALRKRCSSSWPAPLERNATLPWMRIPENALSYGGRILTTSERCRCILLPTTASFGKPWGGLMQYWWW